jgi:hypothetical protein
VRQRRRPARGRGKGLPGGAGLAVKEIERRGRWEAGPPGGFWAGW